MAAGLGGVVPLVVGLGVCWPSWVRGRLDGNGGGWGDMFVEVGVATLALKLLVGETVVSSNPEGGYWPMGY